MDISKIIRSSIIIQWALIALGFTISFFEEKNLPPSLKNYLQLENEAGLSNIETIGLCLVTVALLGFIVSSIGVYQFKRWSRSLYLWSNIFGLIFPIDKGDINNKIIKNIKVYFELFIFLSHIF